MKRPVRTTVIFGIISALGFLLFASIPSYWWDYALFFKLFFLLIIALYSILLCRWSGTSPAPIIFPLLLLLGVALWSDSVIGFQLTSLAVFSWIRSGICYQKYPLRAVLAESLSVAGGVFFIVFLWPGTILAQALVIWLFFLVQALYFYIIPVTEEDIQAASDSFEQACRDMERLLDNCK